MKSRRRSRKKPGLPGILLPLLLAAVLTLNACGNGSGMSGSGRTAGGQAAESGSAPADTAGGAADAGTAEENADPAAPDSETYRALASKHQQQEEGAEELKMTAKDLPAAAKAVPGTCGKLRKRVWIMTGPMSLSARAAPRNGTAVFPVPPTVYWICPGREQRTGSWRKQKEIRIWAIPPRWSVL